MTDPRRQSGGFTLVEMLAAMGILALGFSSVVGVMSVGVSTRRTAELRNQAVYAVDQVLGDVRAHVAKSQEFDEDGVPVPLEPLEFAKIEGHPRLRAGVTFHYAPEQPELVRVVLRVSWLEEGLQVGEEFQRIIDTYPQFAERVARTRNPR